MRANFELKAHCADLELARERARELATAWLGVDEQVRREIALYENVRIHLDRVEGLGTFIELGAVCDGDDAGLAAQERSVACLRGRLGVRDVDLIAGSEETLLGA